VDEIDALSLAVAPERRVAPKMELRDLPKPEPSAGMDALKRELDLALASDPRKKANYEHYLASRRRNATVDYLPVQLDIENVSRCNFRCTMCVVSDWPKGKRGPDMELEDFKHLIDDQYGLVVIKLQGIGEPTMQGDPYFDMIRYARSKHIWVRTTTNASLLHLKDRYKKMVDSGVNEIQISIDGATKEVFEAIRRGSRFEQVIKNCTLINAYARDKGVRVTKMWTLVQKANRHQVFDFVDLAKEIGFRDMTFAFSLANWGSDDWRQKNDGVTVEESLTVELAQELAAKGAALGIKVGFWNSTDKYSTESEATLCPWPFERAVVTSDLRVVPCCTIGNPDAYEIGRGSGKSFGELWQSEEYKAFRQAHLDRKIPRVCQVCYQNSGHS
jgi:MoaA/NifB/PqqE/SkfB family radical SAM enzyme